MISTGTLAPRFTLPDQNSHTFRLERWLGQHNVLLLFIPVAFTPICTTELPALNLYREQFWDDTNTVVAAITSDTPPANREWARRCEAAELYVLSDHHPIGEVSKAYGAWIPSEGIPDRATVIIGRDGRVQYSESVGKFGKRSIPALLQMAASINGSRISPPRSVRMPLDLPVLFVMNSCPHCQQLLDQLRQLRAEDRVVVREVSSDRGAFDQLLQVEPQGRVPTLWWQGRPFTGRSQIEPQLSAITSVDAA